jgi:hypothetical protein
MTIWSRIMSATKAGISAFRESFLSGDTVDIGDYADFEARRMRYAIYWAMYENTAFRDIHKWARAYRASFGLYKYIRGIYNPSYRLGEFWKSHLIGGALDPAAGDGESVKSALPILTQNERLRPALSNLWRASNWGVNKDILAQHGTILGDAVVMIVDDTERQKVYLDVVHPGILADVSLDRWGNVKGYVLEEERTHPETGKAVTYREEATRDGFDVVYKTFANGNPYAWDGESANWTVSYGFVPMVFIQHNNVGLGWGWSELHPGRVKFNEADDLGSNLNDFIRINRNAPFLLAGVRNPKDKSDTNPRTEKTGATPTNKQAGREEAPVLYGDVGATAIPLVSDMSVADATAQLATVLQELERDYPELNNNLYNVTGDISGRALRVHREPVEDRVRQRRTNYDDAIVRAQQMAIAIGGYRDYPGYEGFGLDSFAAGALDHSIADRPVFREDPMEKLEQDTEFWKAAKEAGEAGYPLEAFLRDHGWTDEQIQQMYSGVPEQ